MCVAAIINTPVPLKDLEHMETTNPDGGGVGWLDKKSGKFRYIKGITAKDIHGLQEAGIMSYPYLLHFRWATHGPKVPALCHPFPVGVKALYDESSGVADSIMMHNGTWSAYDKWIPDWLPQKVADNLSDTAVAAYVAAYFPEILEEVRWATAMATVDGDGNISIAKTGSWDEHEGNSYSNMHWHPTHSYVYSSHGRVSYGPTEWWETWRGKDWQKWAATQNQAGDDEGEDLDADSVDDLDYKERGLDHAAAIMAGQSYESFEEYVERKYGPDVARLAMEIDPDGSHLTNSELEAMAMSNLEGWTPYQSQQPQHDYIGGYADDSFEYDSAEPREDYDSDSELVSEDPETVNQWLASHG